MKILNKTAALSVLCFAAILTLSACSDKRQKGNERLAKEKRLAAKATAQSNKQ
ncbi:MAG: hypothetical protein J6V99_07860 [Neisseriaceae bacterium]|nr:hypothetical protein [Neisseriaceae bacterium]